MDTEKISGRDRFIVLVVTTLVAFIVPFMISAVNIALPRIGEDLNMNAIVMGWVPTAYFLASASLLVPFGRLADIYGRRKVFVIGTLTFSLGSILCPLAPSISLFLGARVIQGIGGAMIFGTAIAILITAYPPGARGRVLGFNAGATYLGISLGPPLGGLLTDHVGWRSIFFIAFALCLMVAVMVMRVMKTEWAEARGQRFDYGGSVIFAASLVALIYGLASIPATYSFLLLVGAAVGLFIFILWEDRVSSPLLQLRLFRNNHAFIFSNLATLINYSATYAVTFLLSLFLQYNRGLSPETAGLILVCSPAMQSLFSPVAGRLSDRVEPRILASGGMAVTTVGLGLLIFTGENSIIYIVAALLILGFGFGLFASPNTNAVMSSVSRDWYGVASAALATSRQIGIMLSMGIAMLTFALFIGQVEITPAYYDAFAGSVRIAFIIFTALCFLGIFASLARGNVLKAGSPQS